MSRPVRSLARGVARGVSRGAHGVDAALALGLLALVRAYQLLLSPLVGPVCRYAPSCSSYAAQALTDRGACVGVVLIARRLARCHPWARGGWDPVPVRRAPASSAPGPSPAGQPASEPLPEPARTA